MKKIILSLAIVMSGYCAYAQNTFPSSGYVGIGTTAPNYPITLNSSAETGLLTIDNGTSLYISHGGWNLGAGKLGIGNPYLPTMVINTTANGGSGVGNVGIGTTNPQRKLDLSNAGQLTFGDDVVTSSNNGVFWHSGYNYGIYRTSGPWTGNTYQQLRVQFDTGIQLAPGPDVNTGYDKSFVEIVTGKGLMVSSGNVGIGTTDTKGYKLAVNGSAIATSITVKSYGSWPDYVFKKSYKLPSLSDVKSFIDKNNHLPDMPSEQEVKDNGINLGEIVKIQTKKIEELTLYLVSQQKQIDDLKGALMKRKKRIHRR